MEIINTYPDMLAVYEGTDFNFKKWKSYIDSIFPGASSFFISDLKKCLETGKVFWEKDYLPVLNEVALNVDVREKAYNSFCKVTENLECTIYDKFGKGLDVDIVFYLGLCNAAGWATEYKSQKTIFLGIEKIMELNWCGIDDMYGLIYHELGHIYQGQYGVINRTFNNNEDTFLWQLFTEGIAMYFEQMLVGSLDYYHQDRVGWKKLGDYHFGEIRSNFSHDLKTSGILVIGLSITVIAT